MGDDGIGAPLSRRVPGAARVGPGQPVPPVLPESVLNRMQAAIDAEHAHAEVRGPGEPNTEPMPRVTVSGSPSKHAANPARSPSGVLPETEVPQDRAARPEGVARPPRAAKPQRAEEPLRVAKALRAAEELQAAAAARVHAAEPEPPSAAEQEPVRAAEAPPPAEPPYPAQPPRAAEPPSGRRPMVSAAFESGPTPGSIGWLWPEETATRGGGGPRWQPPGRWRYRTATLVALGAVVLAGAGLVVGKSLLSTPVAGAAHGKSSPKAAARPTANPDGTPATTPTPTASFPAAPNTGGLAFSRTSAAAWVAQQVAAGTVVACDVQTCAALTASGLPAGQLVQVGLNSQSLSNASIVVVTPALRTLFSTLNPSLGTSVAPQVLASFGQITIQVIYPAGAAAYQAALSQDVQARVQVGQQLLNSGRVSASPTAASELAAGDVDSRVLLAIQALANQQPIDVLGFDDSGPGAGPGIPFRAVDLAETDPSAGMPQSAYLQSMVQVLRAHATFPAFTKAMQVTLADGQTAVQIEYAAPSPLGLLAPS